ncbi:isoprenylcysteine carboxylmethyltransferase family protein [Aureimonas sp. AU20]|uniref:methyltransferase family protein n=1 Tax=Aureimonas sp. AU20 TaxID=1349819 RepID=UPI00178CEBB2|nr:isoprenylcysteine carboxylmethyltransferase family protein [Aureimonas sp. AU20]
MADIRHTQRRRKVQLRVLVIMLTPLFLYGSSAWEEASLPYEAIQAIGLLAIFVAIMGRTWCTLYIGGRKIEHLVVVGPYSLCRNPLYLFTYIAVFGMAAQSGSIVLAAIGVCGVAFVFATVVRDEEALLRETHGQSYAEYAERTPRILPHLSLWNDTGWIQIKTQHVVRTASDGCLFLLAWPAFEALERMRQSGLLEPRFGLY